MNKKIPHEKEASGITTQPEYYKVQLKQISIDPSTDVAIQLALAKYQLIYSTLGLLLGLASMIGGVYLFVKGITGSMDWIAEFIGVKSNIVNAAPGAVLFIVGLFMVFVTRYNFKHIKVK